MDEIDPFEVVLAVDEPSYNEEDDEDDEDEYYNTIALVVLYGLEHLINDDDDTRTHPVIFDRIPIHPGQSLRATEIAELLMAGSDVEFQDCFRMPKGAFHSLAHWLRRHGVEDSRYQSVEHKLMVFLYIIAYGEPQRNAAHRFQIAQSTVSDIFHHILDAIAQLHTEVVVQPEDSYVAPYIELSNKRRQFNGCIGAIDGTLLPAHIPLSQQRRFFDRKGNLSQNVFFAVNFDYTFSYVLAGAEGSMNDKQLLSQALARDFRPPPGRFYLADGGFGDSRAGIVTPFAGQRYYPKEFNDCEPTSSKELYNISHARIRGWAERVLGLVKRKFKILRGSPAEYDFATQTQLVYGVTAVWNFLLRFEAPEPVEYSAEAKEVLRASQIRADYWIDKRPGFEIRFNIAVCLWRERQRRIAQRNQQQQ